MSGTLPNMKPSTLLFASLLLFCQHRTSAQSGEDFKYTWSDEKVYHSDFFKGNAENGYIYLGLQGDKEIVVRHLDNQLHRDGEVSFTPPGIAKEFALHKLLTFGNKNYLTYSTYDKSEEKEMLFVQEIDPRTGKLTGNPKLLASSDTKIQPNNETSNNWMFFEIPEKWWFFVSKDQSKVMIQYRLRPEHTNDKVSSDKIGFIVLDAQLNQLWTKEVKMPYTEARMDNQDYHVDNDGNVYVLAKVYSSDEGRKSASFRFEVLKYTKEADQAIKYPFSLTGKFANSAKMDETADNKLFVTGFYSSLSRKNSAEGFYLFKINDLADTVGKTQKWMHAFGKDIMNGGAQDGDDAGPVNLELHQVVALPDGGIQLVGEERNTTVGQIPNSTFGGSSSQTDIYCNNLLVVQVDKNGNMAWMTPIRKKQKSVKGMVGSMSFSSFHKNGNSYFFFMNNEDNLNREAGGHLKYYKSNGPGVLQCVKIDAKGMAAAPWVITTPFKDNGFAYIRDFAAVSDNSMIVTSTDGKKEASSTLLYFQ